MPLAHVVRRPRPYGRRSRRLTPVAMLGLALGLLFAAPAPAHAGGGSGADAGWRLVWRDDFTGPARSPVDPDAWIPRLGHCYPGCPAANWGTGEIPEMTDSLDNAALDGAGHLLITPLRDPVDGDRWTAARLETRRADFAAPVDGALRVEARLALPAATGAEAQGFRTAFWMLGAPFRTEYRDPQGAGDLDVAENVNDRPEVIGTVHCSPPGKDPCQEVPDNVGLAGATTCPPSGCRQGMHTYAVEVHRESSPQRIDWLVDGHVYHSVGSDRPGMDDATWRLMIDRSFFLILSQSIGGGWPGEPTTSTRSGVPLVVDHVAVFVRRPGEHHPEQGKDSRQHRPREGNEQGRRDGENHRDEPGRHDVRRGQGGRQPDREGPCDPAPRRHGAQARKVRRPGLTLKWEDRNHP